MYNQYPRVFNQQGNIYEQNMYDQIDNQIKQLQQMKEQVKNNVTPPAINQTFQLAPNNRDGMKYANSIDEVQREMIVGDTPFFSKDMSVVWVKDAKGNIKTYELNEIIPKDEKDIQIEYLQEQIRELKGMFKNEQFNTNVDAEQDATDTTGNDETIGEPIKKEKPTSVSRISTSKKK